MCKLAWVSGVNGSIMPQVEDLKPNMWMLWTSAGGKYAISVIAEPRHLVEDGPQHSERLRRVHAYRVDALWESCGANRNRRYSLHWQRDTLCTQEGGERCLLVGNPRHQPETPCWTEVVPLPHPCLAIMRPSVSEVVVFFLLGHTTPKQPLRLASLLSCRLRVWAPICILILGIRS